MLATWEIIVYGIDRTRRSATTYARLLELEGDLLLKVAFDPSASLSTAEYSCSLCTASTIRVFVYAEAPEQLPKPERAQ